MHFINLIFFALIIYLFFKTRSLQEQIDSLKNLKPLPQKKPAEAVKAVAEKLPKKPVLKQKKPEPVKEDIEQNIGSKLAVWIGGIALAFAGFYFVKYSIEMMSPSTRIILGIIFGILLLGVGEFIFRADTTDNNKRIMQALTGAGIIDLYLSIMAAHTMYSLIPANVAFGIMACITLLAAMLSLRYGMPVALMALGGGFLTPMMIGSTTPNYITLMIYLYGLFAGFMYLIRSQNWWRLAAPATFGVFLWAFIVLLSHGASRFDKLSVGLFLFAVSATYILTTMSKFKDEYNQGKFTFVSLSNYGVAFLSIVTILSTSYGVGITPFEASTYVIISLACMGLAAYDQKLYWFMGPLSLAFSAAMLIVLGHKAPIWLLIAYTAAHVAPAAFMQLRNNAPRFWASMGAGSATTFFLIAKEFGAPKLSVPQETLFGLVLAAIFGLLAFVLQNANSKSKPDSNHAISTNILTCSAMALLTLVYRQSHLTTDAAQLVIAAQLVLTALVFQRFNVNDLGRVLKFVFGAVLILSTIFNNFKLSYWDIVWATDESRRLISLSNITISFYYNCFMDLLIPGALLMYAARMPNFRTMDRFSKVVEVVGSVLLLLGGMQLLALLFAGEISSTEDHQYYTVRALLNAFVLIVAMTWVWYGKLESRKTLVTFGIVMAWFAMWRIGVEDTLGMVFLNPSRNVGDMVLFNSLLIEYVVPLITAFYFVRLLDRDSATKRALDVFMLVISFSYVNFFVRQIFHGSNFSTGAPTDAEIYSYSVAWLLYGVALLAVGVIRNNSVVRKTSLGVMILLVGKVFIFDAAELEGLLRVFTFLGLGLSLIGISWFYGKYVFVQKTPRKTKNKVSQSP